MDCSLVVASTHDEAVYSARQVQIEYKDLPAIISIEDAINAKSFFDDPFIVQSGDVSKAELESDIIVEGKVEVGGQERMFYVF